MSLETHDKSQQRRDVRRVLWQWGDTMRKCKRKMDELTSLQAMIDDARQLGATTYDGMPKGTVTSNPTERRVIKIEDIIESYGEAMNIIQTSIDRAMTLKTRVDELIDNLPPEQQRVIVMRYVDDYSWRYVGFKLNRDESSVRAIECRAVDTLAQSILISQSQAFSSVSGW